MAGEIQCSAVVSIVSGEFRHLKQLSQDNQDLSANVASGGIASVSAAAAALPVGDVTNVGWAYFKNLTTDATMEVGADSAGFVAFLRLLPGQFAGPMPLGAAPYAKTTAGTGELEYYILERETEGS